MNKNYNQGRQRQISKPNRESVSDKHEDKLRLNKYIAASGICSRRDADSLITRGKVEVNGEVVKELGIKVSRDDAVMVNGKPIKPEKNVYILLNKPKDCVTTVSDPHAKITVLDIVKNACSERVYPVGRLDRNTTGVLLLTNDGDLAKELTHPSSKKMKVYHVFLDKAISPSDFEKLVNGFELEDGLIKADSVSYVSDDNKRELGIELHSGRNRIVRRMFEHLGYKVIKLDRVYFAGLTKKGLQRSHWRFLTQEEIGMLKKGAYR
ncbi:MAG: rRNA pseudouridine synthase [Bacteroidales bacterium]|nr:rRNA pseudouridine synthase [Bacteroidales bacterium]MBN2817483.1 rRNA pseudouridine synthase [Bacteroidales bacterium]